MASGVPKCPVCKEMLLGGAMVCKDCGQVYCGYCPKNVPDVVTNAGICPRCGSTQYISVSNWDDIFKAMRGNLPLD